MQGVWYRGATHEQALNLGINGYARNLADGRVEVLACGDEEAVVALERWLWQGPRHAQVTDVVATAVDHSENIIGFHIA